jgi:hypothetical protein
MSGRYNPNLGTGPRTGPRASSNPMGHARGKAAVAERHRRYAELRDEGMNSFAAGLALGIDPWKTAARYERAYHAARSET